MLPSFSEDVTRAMRKQPKRLSRNYLRRNGGNVILHVLISLCIRDDLYTLSRLFVRLFCARLAVHSTLHLHAIGGHVSGKHAISELRASLVSERSSQVIANGTTSTSFLKVFGTSFTSMEQHRSANEY